MAAAQLLSVLFLFVAFLSVATCVRGSTGSYTGQADDVSGDGVQVGVHASKGPRRDGGRDHHPNAGTPQRMEERGGSGSRKKDRSSATSTPGKSYRVSLSSRPRRATVKLLWHVASVFAASFILAIISAMCFTRDGGPKRAGMDRRSLSVEPQHVELELCSLLDPKDPSPNRGLLAGRSSEEVTSRFGSRLWWRQHAWLLAEVLVGLTAVVGIAVMTEGFIKKFSSSVADQGNSSTVVYTNGSIPADNATRDGVVSSLVEAQQEGQQQVTSSAKKNQTVQAVETGDRSNPSADPPVPAQQKGSFLANANDTMRAGNSMTDGGVVSPTLASVVDSAHRRTLRTLQPPEPATPPTNVVTNTTASKAPTSAEKSVGWTEISMTATLSCSDRFQLTAIATCWVTFPDSVSPQMREQVATVGYYFKFPRSFNFLDDARVKSFTKKVAESAFSEWNQTNFTCPYKVQKEFKVPVPEWFSLATPQ
ncbi:hypothetical protein CSUI_011209, partial [Cystoisospora suis]